MEQKDTHDHEKKAVRTNCIKTTSPVTTSSRKNNYTNNTTTATSTSSANDNKKTTCCSPRKASTPVTNTKSVTIRSLSTKIKEATMINNKDEAERMDKNGGHGIVLGKRSNAITSSLLKNLSLCSSSTTGTTIISSKKSSGVEKEQESPSNNNKAWHQEPPAPSSPPPPQQPANVDRESIETPSSEKKNPYLNKTIRIINGQFEGLTGKIIKVHTRGWWTLDNPELNGKNVHPRFCELVDKIDSSELADFYGKRPKNRGLPSIVLRQQEQEFAKKKRRREVREYGPEKERKRPPIPPPQQETWGQRMRPKTRRVTSSANPTPHCSSTSSPVARERRAHANDKTTQRHRQTCASSPKQPGGLGRTKRVLITSIVATKGDSPSKRVGLHPSSRPGHKKKRRRTARTNQQVLPPFLLNSQEDDHQAHEALRHLPPDYKVEIFNRKTGRILRGSDAVTSKDLSSVLRRHAEYEPLIPQREKNVGQQQVRYVQEVASREARSSVNAHINEHVQPQTKVRASTAEGRRVKITAGPYCGLTGKVESCIPGNWYLVSDLSKKNKFDFDYIVHANNLEMLVERSDTGNHQKKKAKVAPGEVEKGLTSLKKLIKSLELRIHNLEEQKAFLLSSSGSADKELAKKDEQLKSAREKLDVKNIAYKMLEGK